MRRLIKPMFWTVLFLLILLALDQFFVQVPPVHPAHAAVSNFYRDFRGRLIALTFGDHKTRPKSIEAVIDAEQETTGAAMKTAAEPVKKKTRSTNGLPAKQAQRYIYSDGKGELHFAESLEEVPDQFRGQAQPMGQ